MKNMRSLGTAIPAIIFILLFAGCSKNDDPIITEPVSGSKLRITIGSSIFRASLYDNATAKAFTAMLPLSLSMSELNGNEKLYDFQSTLPSNASDPGGIQNGDIMLYGNRTLVLFYKSFSTSYTYTRIGKVEDVSGYAAALGSGSVRITFELE
jgi:hypothetical protein